MVAALVFTRLAESRCHRLSSSSALEHARRRTEDLLEPLSDEQLTLQISPLQSPLVWDLAHIGHFEELWLLRRVGGLSALSSDYDDLYDSFAHARGERGSVADPATASRTRVRRGGPRGRARAPP